MIRTHVGDDGRLVIERGAPAGETKTPAALLNLFTAGIEDLDGGGRAVKLSDPYRNSVWVMRAIKHVAGPISAVPLKITRDKRGGDVVVEDPELTKFLEAPFTYGGETEVDMDEGIEASIGWLKLCGEYFWILDDTWLTSKGRRNRILIVRPDEMTPKSERPGGPVAWWEWRRGSQKEILSVDQVIHRKFWNPYDLHRGLAEWEAAKIAASSDYAAGTFARNLSENNGDRGPIISAADGGVLSDEQIQQITAQLRQKKRAGRRGEFKAAFLTGDVKVQEAGIQAVDAAFVTQRLENRHEIFVAFGVPPSMASLVANYSVGSSSDRYKLIEETCIPNGKKITGGFEYVLKMWFGGQGTYFCELEWDAHSTMQEVRGERFESATKAVASGMPWEKASEYFRLGMPGFTGWEIGRVPFNLTEIRPEEPKKNEEPGDQEDPLDELEKIFRAAPVAAGRTEVRAPSDEATEQDPKRRELWEQVHRARKPWEKRFESRFRRHLMDARRRTLEKIAEAAKQELAVKAPSDALVVIFDLGEWLREFVTGMGEVTRNAMEAAGLELWTDELDRDDPLTMPAQEVMAALRERENRLANTATDIWERVRAALGEGISKGETTDELSSRVKTTFNGISNERARRIAVTETTVAYETGRDMTFQAAGVEWTEWVHSGLAEGARPRHQAADGQVREMGEPFDIGGVPMAYPGDPEAPAEEVINCRCVRIARSGPDAGAEIEGNDNDEIPY